MACLQQCMPIGFCERPTPYPPNSQILHLVKFSNPSIDRSLAEDNRWGCYTVEYYQTVMQILTELTHRPTLLLSDLETTIDRLEQICQTMIQAGMVTDQELEDYVEV